MKYIKFFIIFLFFISIKNFAYTENNLAFLDMQYIMEKSLVGQSLKNQLEKLHKKNLSYFKEKEDSLKKKENEILTKKNILSKDEFQKEISKLRDDVKNYNKERNERIDSLTKKRLETMEKILKDLSPILAEFSKENNISIIIDKKNIIVGKTELNITEKILNLLDSKIKKIKLN